MVAATMVERVNTYTDPDMDLLLSSSRCAPINAVSPYKETEAPKHRQLPHRSRGV